MDEIGKALKLHHAETQQLLKLLRRAWYRLSICVCHGERGSSDYVEHQRLLDDIDAQLPLGRNLESDSEYICPACWVKDEAPHG